MKHDINKVRQDFPQLARHVHGRPLVYLDNAASTLKVRPVIEAIAHHYSEDAANIHRGVHFLSEQGTVQFEQTRETVQAFIHAQHRHEIIFTKGTTESINLVAQCFGAAFLKAGDEILLTTMEHHSNIVPWQMIAEKYQVKIKVAPINERGEIILDEYARLLSPRTRLVSAALVSNALGTINPIQEMITLAHEVGAKFFVDAAQATAHIPINVQELDCDFLAFSSHKMFGPTGVGVLYGKEELLNAMPPYQGGGDMIDVVTFEKTTYNELPHKFEAGTPHIAGVIAFKAALEYIQDLGLTWIGQQEERLLGLATQALEEIKGVRLIGTAAHKSAVLSFVMQGAHHHDIGTLLDRQGIAVRTGHHCTQPLMQFFGITGTTRASFCFYNTEEEVRALAQGLRKVQELL